MAALTSLRADPYSSCDEMSFHKRHNYVLVLRGSERASWYLTFRIPCEQNVHLFVIDDKVWPSYIYCMYLVISRMKSSIGDAQPLFLHNKLKSFFV